MGEEDKLDGVVCLSCGQPATTTKKGATVPLCAKCAALAKGSRGVTVGPKKQADPNVS